MKFIVVATYTRSTRPVGKKPTYWTVVDAKSVEEAVRGATKANTLWVTPWYPLEPDKQVELMSHARPDYGWREGGRDIYASLDYQYVARKVPTKTPVAITQFEELVALRTARLNRIDEMVVMACA